jgi:hypothetical protein
MKQPTNINDRKITVFQIKAVRRAQQEKGAENRLRLKTGPE